MQRTHKIIAYSFIILCLHSSLARTAPPAGNDAAVPDWTLQTNEGRSINLYNDSDNNVAIILFWATWCPYCRTLMPHLQQVANEYQDKPVKFYALNVWEDGDPVTYMQENNFTFTLLLKSESAAEAYGVKGTPGLFVVDTEHRVRYMRVSGEDDISVKHAVQKAIDVSLPIK